jgi:GTPase SAR1 family protein
MAFITHLAVRQDEKQTNSICIQSAKTNQNVEEVFFTIARDIKQRLTETVAAATEVTTLACQVLI